MTNQTETTPEPFAWYSPRHGDTLTDKQKTERAAYLPLDAAAYSVALFTGAPVVLAEPWHSLLIESAALFRMYEHAHRMKGAGHEEKVKRNADIAERIENALDAAPVAPAEQSHAVSYMEGISDGRAEVKPALVPPQSTQAVQMGLAACDAGGFVATTNAVLAVWRACEKFHGVKP